MQVAVIGADGGIGRELFPRLTDAGHGPVGAVRDESQFETIRDHGGKPRLGDLEDDLESALDRADAVVLTVDSGRSTGVDRTLMVGLWGTRRAVGACVEAGIDRFMIISSTDAGDPLSDLGALRPYLVAKRCADDYLEQSSLNVTILRPAKLAGAEGTGSVSLTIGSLDDDTPEAPRADVTQAVVASLDIDRTVGETLALTGGDTTIKRALRGDDWVGEAPVAAAQSGRNRAVSYPSAEQLAKP